MRIPRLLPVLAVALIGFVASGPASAVVQTQTVADGAAVAFSLRPTYDAGGAAPLNLYVGYTAANVGTPEPEADGQASWYYLAILETGAFLPPEQCTPQKNLEATLDGAQDVQGWLAAYIQSVFSAAEQLQQPPPPTVPGPRHACVERFPGFAQSRYPATNTMADSTTDNYLDKPAAAQACRQDPGSASCEAYEQYWPTFRGVTGAAARDGSFFAESTPQPSQHSESLLMGAGDGMVVSVGLARTTSNARLEGEALIVESSSLMDDVCLVGVSGECTVRIDHIRQHARIVKAVGRPIEHSAGTVITGVKGAGVARDVTASDLAVGSDGLDLGGYLRLDLVSQTGTCTPGQADPSVAVADAGGLLLSMKGGEGGQGGSMMIGGACARARVDKASFGDGGFDPAVGVSGGPSVEVGSTGDGGDAPIAVGPAAGAATPGEFRTISRTVTRYELETPLAWRTAPYWGVIVALLAMGAIACRLFPRHPAVAPAARAVDQFARRFLRG